MMNGEWKRGRREEAVMFNFGFWILNDEWGMEEGEPEVGDV